jgi:hypothetical protein
MKTRLLLSVFAAAVLPSAAFAADSTTSWQLQINGVAWKEPHVTVGTGWECSYSVDHDAGHVIVTAMCVHARRSAVADQVLVQAHCKPKHKHDVDATDLQFYDGPLKVSVSCSMDVHAE